MNAFPFDTIGFDLDGTLVDTAPDLCRAVNAALTSAGRPTVSAEVTREMIGGGTRAMLTRAFERTGGMVADEEFAQAYDVLMDFYFAHTSAHSQPYPGLLDALDALAARGCKLAVCTNKVEQNAVKLLDELGMSHRFAAILGGDTMGPGRSKPQPDMLDEALRRCGGKRFAMVGDASFDVLAAKAAGAPCVVYAPGYHDMPVAELGADAIIEDYGELAGALEGLQHRSASSGEQPR
ncbi:HAD-IA family hydrolase [Tsuneonella sp. HG222]